MDNLQSYKITYQQLKKLPWFCESEEISNKIKLCIFPVELVSFFQSLYEFSKYLRPTVS